ncbi:reelin [Caerostris extrusa]|uniref:Reelin n=1 Tax=Caerostris extrusa TaxID=172846 RepID=A0AAV4R1X3_CAEEX|nr:reelin [Caerostris extrusa]
MKETKWTKLAAMLHYPYFLFILSVIVINLNTNLVYTQNVASVASPFFFFVNIIGILINQEQYEGEIALSVNIKGSPEYYEPGKVYEVTVSSSLDFDGFLMTGLYTAPSGTVGKTMNLLNNNLPNEQDGVRGLVCAIVHSHLSHRPAKSLMFLWMAPPSGTGCVNFLATASLGHEVLFKDTLALQLCEAGESVKSVDIPTMSAVHDPGLVIREDFENYDEANSLIWSEMISGVVNDQCGSTTVPLNTTTASTLQFALGTGNCTIAVDEPPINVYYGTDKCTKWHELEQIRLQPAVETTVHILCLPPSAKSTDVCIQWYQETSDSGKFKGCWAIDNIIISSVSDRPNYVEDNFDQLILETFVLSWWYSSDGNALTFAGHGHHRRAVVTRDLDMSTAIASQDIIFNEMFHKVLHRGENCSAVQPDTDMSHNTPVLVYAKLPVESKVMLTDVIHAAVMEPVLVSLPIPAEAQTSKTRFCWTQASNNGINKDIVAVEFSTTSGHTWHSLHEMCLPPICNGSHSSLRSRLTSHDMKGWNKVSYPIPYAALVTGVRFRVKQSGKYTASNWAIDDVYIGECPNGCSGHGKCTNSGCQCDMGYSGQKCEIASVVIPSYLSEMFQSSKLNELPGINNLLGAEMGYQCGSLGSGKAVVFDHTGPRFVITKEVNTTFVRFLQFTLRIGSSSKKVHVCHLIIHQKLFMYIIHVMVAFLGNFLELFDKTKFRDPKIVSLPLATSAQQPWCMFKIWQPYHSDLNAMNTSIRYSSGVVKNYCSSEKAAVVFDEEVYNGVTRSLETKSITVGPSYMVQFDLLMGCGSMFSSEKKNQVRLEFSTNHGMNWFPVYKPCLPSNGSCNGVFTKGTVYDATEFSKWKRVTVSLLPATWSSSTRFRFIQHEFDTSDNWALDNLYIGPQCKDMCSGHGRCIEGTCMCDRGFLVKVVYLRIN